AARVVHWSFAVLFVYALTKQLDFVEQLEDRALLRFEVAFACVFLVVLFARFVYMRKAGATALPEQTPDLVKLLARACHLGMYAGLSLTALSGIAIGALYGSGTKDGIAMEIVISLHEVSIGASIFLILLHIGAAIMHRRAGDGIWSAMVPFWKEPAPSGDRASAHREA
ncbi:MAG: cytochrome b/b6 domain-containing protein, partial [Pseudomonadota bacterium]